MRDLTGGVAGGVAALLGHQPGLDGELVEGAGEVEALAEAATQALQLGRLGRVLDALGDDLQVEEVGDAQDGVGEGGLLGTPQQPVHERLGQLEGVHRQVAQVGERRAASKSSRCTARVCMAVSNTRTPARPAVLAAYMAMSASRSSRSGSSSPPRASRTPTLALASTSRPDTVTGLRRMAAIRSPRATASPSSATSGTSTANSPPPSRAARSPGPRQPRSCSATTRRTSSPEEWPRLSLIVLKSSRSSSSRAGD